MQATTQHRLQAGSYKFSQAVPVLNQAARILKLTQTGAPDALALAGSATLPSIRNRPLISAQAATS